jgi:hypothetical protein
MQLCDNETGNVCIMQYEDRSCNKCCSGKATRISVDLGIQHAMRIAPYCHLSPAQLYSIFPRYLIKGTIFRKRKKNY